MKKSFGLMVLALILFGFILFTNEGKANVGYSNLSIYGNKVAAISRIFDPSGTPRENQIILYDITSGQAKIIESARIGSSVYPFSATGLVGGDVYLGLDLSSDDIVYGKSTNEVIRYNLSTASSSLITDKRSFVSMSKIAGNFVLFRNQANELILYDFKTGNTWPLFGGGLTNENCYAIDVHNGGTVTYADDFGGNTSVKISTNVFSSPNWWFPVPMSGGYYPSANVEIDKNYVCWIESPIQGSGSADIKLLNTQKLYKNSNLYTIKDPHGFLDADVFVKKNVFNPPQLSSPYSYFSNDLVSVVYMSDIGGGNTAINLWQNGKLTLVAKSTANTNMIYPKIFNNFIIYDEVDKTNAWANQRVHLYNINTGRDKVILQ